MKTSVIESCRYAILGFAAAALLLPGIALSVPPPANDQISITLSPNPVVEPNDATITGTLKDTSGNLLSGQDMKIQMMQVAGTTSYDPAQGVPCSASTDNWQQAGKGLTDSSGNYSVTFPTSGLGGKSICFRAQHAKGSGSWDTAMTAGDNLVIQAAPSCTGVTLSNPTIVSLGSYIPHVSVSGPWQITMTLTNCLGQPVDFKVQGGANAWAPLDPDSITTSDDPSADITVSKKKKNSVITWKTNVTDGDSKFITFTVGTDATLQCGAIPITQYLSGAWSAAYVDPDTGLAMKAGYNDPATVSIEECQ